ncbi:protein Frey 1 [Chlamydotis macqueenii]
MRAYSPDSQLHPGLHQKKCDQQAERVSYSVPEDFSAPLELPQQHFGLVDDYGIKPKQPRFRTQPAQQQLEGLHRAGKSKRDELELLEYYDDARL